MQKDRHETKNEKEKRENERPSCEGYVRVRWVIETPKVGYGNTKITQHALNVSRVFVMLRLDTVRKKKKGKNEGKW